MKIAFVKLCMCFILVLGVIVAKEKLKTNSETSGDILGEASSDGNVMKGAITYSLGSNGGYALKDENGYHSPKYQDKIPEKFDMPPPGPQESVDEVPSTTDYYDGSHNLNTVKIQCRIYANPTDCLHQSSCGWCGSANNCILGNNLGPLQPCLKSSYIFTAPFPNWNPQTKVVNEQIGGVGLTVVSK